MDFAPYPKLNFMRKLFRRKYRILRSQLAQAVRQVYNNLNLFGQLTAVCKGLPLVAVEGGDYRYVDYQ